jgi:hypothetical protein
MLKGQCNEIFDLRFFFIKQYILVPLFKYEFEYEFEYAKIWSIFEAKIVHAVSMTLHAQQFLKVAPFNLYVFVVVG